MEFITASQAPRYEQTTPLQPRTCDLRETAAACAGDVTYAVVRGRWHTASELLSLFARAILGRHLTPELLYGPEAAVPSVIRPEVTPRALAEAVDAQWHPVLGYKQMPDRYTVGENALCPEDVFATLAAAVAANAAPDTQMRPISGILTCGAHVARDADWGARWIIFDKDFCAPRIIEQTRLQCWTIKPANF